MKMEIVKVDWDRKDAGGEDYRHTAHPSIVAAGLMINQPVLIQLPNGRLERANRVLITPKGQERFRREYSADHKREGSA